MNKKRKLELCTKEFKDQFVQLCENYKADAIREYDQMEYLTQKKNEFFKSKGLTRRSASGDEIFRIVIEITKGGKDSMK